MAISASQLSSAIDNLQSAEGNGKSALGSETMLSQFKKCSVINENQLKNAKNIKDLVNINVAKLDK